MRVDRRDTAATTDRPGVDGDGRDAAPAGDGEAGDAPVDSAATDLLTFDTGAPEVPVADGSGGDAPGPDAAQPDAGTDGDRRDSGEARPPDPCATDQPLTTVGCNGEPAGPAAANTFGGRCTTTTGGSAAGTCANTSHFCAEDQCVPLCTATAATEVSTGGCPAGSRCWDTGILTFCYPDCRGPADCATGRCDSARGLCRGP
jgi:hypothetical protein